jgi:hypothetical protein
MKFGRISIAMQKNDTAPSVIALTDLGGSDSVAALVILVAFRPRAADALLRAPKPLLVVAELGR